MLGKTTDNVKILRQKYYFYFSTLMGLVLAYYGLVASAGEFLRSFSVIFLGIPGVLIFALSILALKTNSARKKRIIALITGYYVFIIATLYTVGIILTILGGHRNY